MMYNINKYIYRRLGGSPNREIVFVSFVRACERSCVRQRDDVVSVAGLRKLQKSSGMAWHGVGAVMGSGSAHGRVGHFSLRNDMGFAK